MGSFGENWEISDDGLWLINPNGVRTPSGTFKNFSTSDILRVGIDMSNSVDVSSVSVNATIPNTGNMDRGTSIGSSPTPILKELKINKCKNCGVYPKLDICTMYYGVNEVWHCNIYCDDRCVADCVTDNKIFDTTIRECINKWNKEYGE